MKHDIYKKILDYMGEAVWLGDKDEKTLYANPRFLSLVGYSLEEIIGKESYLFWDAPSVKTVKKENQKRKQGASSEYQGNLVTKNGNLVPVKIIGTALSDGGTIGIMSDQREYLKKVESEHILVQAVEQSTDAVILLDPDGNIDSWNNGANYIFGYKKSIIGKHISKIFLQDDVENFLQTKGVINKYELSATHKNGKKISVSITQTHIKASDKQKTLFYLLTCRDVSNYRKIETEIRSKYDKIQAAYTELGIKKRQLEYIHELINIGQKYKNNTKKICDFIVSSVIMLTEVDGCELLLLNEKKNQLEIISHIGFSQDWIGKRIVDYSDSLTQRAVKNNETLKIYDLNTEILYTRKNLARKNQLTSLLLIPITSGDTCLGTLGLYTKADKKLEIFENDFIEKYAKVISLVLS